MFQKKVSMRECKKCGVVCLRRLCQECYEETKVQSEDNVKRCIVEECGAIITNKRHSYCAECYRQKNILSLCAVVDCSSRVSRRRHRFCTACFRSFKNLQFRCSQMGCKEVAEYGNMFCYRCSKYRLPTEIPCSTPGCPRTCLANNNFQCGVCNHIEKQTLLLIAREQQATLRHYQEFYRIV